MQAVKLGKDFVISNISEIRLYISLTFWYN